MKPYSRKLRITLIEKKPSPFQPWQSDPATIPTRRDDITTIVGATFSILGNFFASDFYFEKFRLSRIS
jgi:hypothetical protein